MCAKVKDKSETPLMKQYYSIKAQYPGALLLFRVGDFYETFDSDAKIASQVLGIVLTKRSNGAASEMDLAGFPHHSLDSYLPKLVRAGYRVAICDQLEDPKLTKTIVKRGVTELVTPGVSYNDKVLESRESNYLASIYLGDNQNGIAFLDISTGEFLAAEGNLAHIQKLIQNFKPAEILCPKGQLDSFQSIIGKTAVAQPLETWVYQIEHCTDKLCRQFQTSNLKGFGISEYPNAIIAAGAALQYLELTHHTQTGHINGLSRIDESKFMWLDGFTVRNLEIILPVYPGGKTLLSILDQTKTPMGARLLRQWLIMPLIDIVAIDKRLDAVDLFYQDKKLLENCRKELELVGDLNRIASKAALNRINPREVLQLARSLKSIQRMAEFLRNTSHPVGNSLIENLLPCQEIIDRIENEIHPDAPINLSKGMVMNDGIDAELDGLRKLAFSGKDYLLEIQKRESNITGIPSLKIGFNNVFGYFLEVTHAHREKVPQDWIRKQTLTNAERYITPELKEYEEKILNAEEKIGSVESALWEALVIWLSTRVSDLMQNARIVAEIDCLAAFAFQSVVQGFTRPELNNGKDLILKNCRHPVIEQQLPPDENYIPNDLALDTQNQRIVILTGPNMSGKSALLRQTAIAVIMAQAGCFVPCSSAQIGLIDKIYTRVGASDNISLGESTFMVEMTETASILNNLSDRSLLLLDEIGRGTSTYDGVSLAWSIAEYIQSHPTQPKTLFATHYHELNELESRLEGVKNYHIAIREQGNKIVFLRKLAPGGSEHSFGIHVAQMAGIPNKVLLRATEILTNLESDRASISGRETLKSMAATEVFQLNMFQTEDPKLKQVKELLSKTDINAISPIDALLKLQELKSKLKDD